MKKFIALVLMVITVLSLSAVALADGTALTNWAYGYTASTNGSTLSCATQYHTKDSTDNYIEVRHSVIGNGSSGGHTNYMYAKIQNGNYVGAKWHAPDMIYWTCTSSNLAFKDISVAPGGRGNTKYADMGFSSVRLEGQFRTH